MKNTIEKIVETVLIQNRIGNYDKKDLELQLQIHPNYPSFQSITDTLDYFDIDNIAVEVPVDALDQLPESFVSLVKKDEQDEIVAVTKKKGNIEINHTSLSSKKFSLEQFKEIWVPKVIAVEYNAKQSFAPNRSFIQTFLAITLAAGMLIALINRSWSLDQALFLLVSTAGLVFSFFALRESLGIQSQAIHQFCTSVGNSNCGDVINNNSGKLFKGFTLSDAGIAFFGSLTLYQIFFGFTSILLVPALIGVPFVIYSIYSQGFIIKKWCAICITIGAISLVLAAIALRALPLTFEVSLLPAFLMISALFTLMYLFAKEKVTENKQYRSDNMKLNQFKRDGQIFDYLLSLSDKVSDTATFTNEIVLGNPNSDFKVISFTNPMCGYCKDAFEAYTRVLKAMGDKLQIVIRLGVNLDDQNAEPTQIALRLMEIYHDQGSESFIAAYSEWFADRTYSKWIKKYNAPKNNPMYVEVLHKQSEWSNSNHIPYTPASVINGKTYPKKYTYNEFFHFIGIMLEKHTETVSGDGHTVEV
ncbi:vitamin K epoxide reductase family protein [Aquimarina gracilis]|uniref:Vitamin K epoxide reductase family protein n=1 Tax=Aquimarina gracilis TaxID=874422 RepID=A0ABU5ZQ51_9FLAO|nr:vitamin K epoxide reductase family protein [Aquimarina gracilis]MEB3344219.1 vitamin K epoxide reductase family protein [Aquimarina gracilis]